MVFRAVLSAWFALSALWAGGAMAAETCSADDEIQVSLKALVTSSGAVNTYFDPSKPGRNLIDPYFGNLFFWHLLSDAKPRSDVMYAAKRWIDWYLDHANHELRPDDDALLMMEGSASALFRRCIGRIRMIWRAGSLKYTAAQRMAVAANFHRLHAPGTIYRFYVNDHGDEVPSFEYFLPDLSRPLESPAMQATVQRYVIDSTDAYGATFISVARRYLELASPEDARSFFLLHHLRLKMIADGSFGAIDPRSGLTGAAPGAPTEYTMDNAEVWAGLRDYIAMLRLMLERDPARFARPADGFLLADEVAVYTRLMNGFEGAIARKLRIPAEGPADRPKIPGENDAGLFYLGWNPADSTPLRSPGGWWDLASFDGPLQLMLQGFPMPDASKDKLLGEVRALPTHAYGTLSHLETVWTYPETWRFLPFARSAGRPPGALPHALPHAMSREELAATARALCEVFIRKRQRAYPFWSSLESARLRASAPAASKAARPP